MSADLLARTLARLGAVRTDAAPSAEARSGAGVHQVRTSAGDLGYLKLTPITLGEDAIAGAERELRFYRQVAPTMPVATPALLDAVTAPDGVALLLSDAGTERPPADWSGEDWVVLGRELARIHTTAIPDSEWARPDPLRATITAPDLDRIRAFWAPVLPALESLLEQRYEISARLGSQPTVLVHGDCHTGNILHAEAGPGLAFCDWQSTGLGRASTDLAFLSVRAAPAGVRVPSVVVDGYLAHYSGDGDPAELRRSILLEELAVYVFDWPAYAAFNDAAGVARVRRRASALADRLGAARIGFEGRTTYRGGGRP